MAVVWAGSAGERNTHLQNRVQRRSRRMSGYMEVRLHCGVVNASGSEDGSKCGLEPGPGKDPTSWNMDEVSSDDGSLGAAGVSPPNPC